MMNLPSQIEAAEISDADLDTVSGGLAAGGAGGLFVESSTAGVCADLATDASTEGFAAGTGVHATAL
ncbi:hypothetical protein ACLGIH_10455 [Streptomyces sp. HMX87]|uniref:hypothetical protein n=1 Tax=Streptomyces sp. HMX87 TaxID=3390849 RepID=UPI003A8BF3DA